MNGTGSVMEWKSHRDENCTLGIVVNSIIIALDSYRK